MSLGKMPFRAAKGSSQHPCRALTCTRLQGPVARVGEQPRVLLDLWRSLPLSWASLRASSFSWHFEWVRVTTQMRNTLPLKSKAGSWVSSLGDAGISGHAPQHWTSRNFMEVDSI